MSRKSPREIERDVQRLQPEANQQDAPDVSVEWRDADPHNRPEGYAYDPEAEVLYFDLWGAQREALDHLQTGNADITAFLAGYGSGKTIFGARWLIEQALAHPNSRFLAMGIDFTKARDATFRVLFEQLPGERTGIVTSSYNGPEQSPIVANFDRQHHRLTLANDTVIKLGSADKWSRHAGDEYGAVWLDEPSHYGEDLHDLLEMIGGRLRGVPGPKVQLWTLTGNGYGPAWEILEEREDKTGDAVGLSIAQVRASTLDNPYLATADKERFRRQYEGTGREEQALHGGFSAGTGLVYAQFGRDTHVIAHERAMELAEPGEWLYGYDAGWRDPRVVIQAAKTDEYIVVVDEFYADGSHVEDAISWLSGRPQGTIYAEHEPSDIEKFNQAGWRAKQADKSLDAGIAEVRKLLRTDPDTGRPGLLVSDTCEHLIREFEEYQEEDVGTSRATDHALDSARYLCMGANSGPTVEWVTARTNTSRT